MIFFATVLSFDNTTVYINISKLRGSSVLPSYLHGSLGAGRRVGGAGQEARSGQASAQEDALYIPVMFLKIETQNYYKKIES